MGKAKLPPKAKLIAGMIYREEKEMEVVKNMLVKEFGSIDFEAGPFPFTHTSYYEREMGKGLKRRFVSFEILIDRERISDVKNSTNKIELITSKNGKRKVNIDPGYVTLDKLVLATTKDYSHRIYLRDGIYAEVTLYFRKGRFHPFEWTYPDYCTKEYIEVFYKIRQIYHSQLKTLQLSL